MIQEYNYSGWRPVRGHVMPFTPRKGWVPQGLNAIPPTRFFDQLCFIGNEYVGCFVLETPEGLMLIDSMDTVPEYIDLLMSGLEALGHKPEEIKKILITHGHGDHFGNAGFLEQKYGAQAYMSREDVEFASSSERPADRRLTFPIHHHIEGGESCELGGISVKAFATPGHTPGCLSFIIPVTDEGRPHKVALWGGTGIPIPRDKKLQYMESSDYFSQVCRDEGVDGEIATHPFVDMSKERLAVCRDIVDGVANPYVIGLPAVLRYQQMFRDLCQNTMEA